MIGKPELKTKKIAVLMGGTSSEREISLASGKAVLESLIRSGYRAVGIDSGRDLAKQLEKEHIEVAFIALHGRWGEDGTVQGLLEVMGIPYTGSGVLGSAVAMDKSLMKLVLLSVRIPTPPYRLCRSEQETAFPLPFIVKPARGGSTIGISVVRRDHEAAEAVRTALSYDDKLILESYIEGREITVGVVNGTTLPIIEVRPHSGFYDYTSKYTKGMTEYLVPAQLNRSTEEEARASALSVWKHFDLSGCVRIDMIVDEHGAQVIDVNTSPGMTETSLVPKAWQHLGKTFDELVEEILMGADLKA